jgi:hypothetical protein
MAERRSAVMIVADAWWEEPGGLLEKGKVRIVNKSVSGACVRMEKRIEVGTKLRIEARWDEFSGVTKYCRSEGSGFLVGIQRQIGVDLIPKQPSGSGSAAAANDQRCENLTGDRGTVGGVSGASPSDQRLPADRRANEERVETARIAEVGLGTPRNQLVAERAAGAMVKVLAPKVSYKRSSRRRWHSSQYEGVPSQEWWEARATLFLKQREAQRDAQEEAQEERGSTAMEINWMGRGKRGVEDASENGSASGTGAVERNKPIGTGGDTGERDTATAPVIAEAPRKERAAIAVERDVTYQNELLPLEEIYSAAGIVSPRRGYSIKKVMEMLQSEHLSALSKEMRRASVMMALDAAGVSVEEVLRDAQVRLDAIKSYEAQQKQLCEGEWARKTDEHAQLKAELEQVRARFMERMKQALDGIARDRARFGTWLTTVHEEAQSIVEAAELCMKVAPPVADNIVPATDEAKETRLKVV